MIIQERHGIALYRRLMELTEGCHVPLEEMARQMIRSGERDLAEIEKMLRNHGDV